MTGLSNVGGDLNQKLVELLRESLPKLQRVGFLADAKSLSHGASVSDAGRVAERLRVEAIVADLALAQRRPVVGTLATIPGLGGLFSYGPDRVALQRRSAHYVDRILKGAKPGDLPVEQPTSFELVLNMKTAATLGIVIPPAMRVRATEVIE